jgi:hypothetical protein
LSIIVGPKPKVGDKGRDKFTEPRSEFLPPAITTWSECLATVRQDLSRIKPTAQIVKGYRFPDPLLFVNTSSERRALYLSNWLRSRAGWIQAVLHAIDPSGGAPPHPSSQIWRDWLVQTVDKANSSSLAPPTPGAISKAKKRKAAASKLFKAQLSDQPMVDSVFWREQQIMIANLDSLAPQTTAEILWELFENN